MTATKSQVSRSELACKIEEASLSSYKSGRNWHYVRVAVDGTVYSGEEVSRCMGESEYFSRKPHEVTIWSEQSNETASVSDGALEWEPCEASEADYFGHPSPRGSEYKRDWCYASEREEFPQLTEPFRLGGYIDPDFSAAVEKAEQQIEECDWLELVD